MTTEQRREVVRACYARHGHEVNTWMTGRAVPLKTTKTRSDAVSGSTAWKAAVTELRWEFERKKA